MFKEDAKGGNKSLEDEKKLQMAGGLCAVSPLVPPVNVPFSPSFQPDAAGVLEGR